MILVAVISMRVSLAILFLFIATKLLNKRSLAQLTYFDYIAMPMLGTIAGNLAFNIKIHLWVFITSMFLMTFATLVISFFARKYRAFRHFVAGKPTVLIQDGKILEQTIRKLNYSYDYLNQQLREEQIFDITQVQNAMLESNGKLSVQLKSDYQPVTAKDLNIIKPNNNLPTELILDGRVIEEHLQELNLSNIWLKNQLKKRNVLHTGHVAFAALSSNGTLYVDLYDDTQISDK